MGKFSSVQFTFSSPISRRQLNTPPVFMFSSCSVHLFLADRHEAILDVMDVKICFFDRFDTRCSAALQPAADGSSSSSTSSAIRSVMAAHVPCDPLDVPIDLTKICIVHPFHTHVVIYGDPDVEAPTLCICNEAAVPGGLLPSETLFSIRWSHGMIRMIEPTNRSIQDALVYTALMARWHISTSRRMLIACSCGGM